MFPLQTNSGEKDSRDHLGVCVRCAKAHSQAILFLFLPFGVFEAT